MLITTSLGRQSPQRLTLHPSLITFIEKYYRAKTIYLVEETQSQPYIVPLFLYTQANHTVLGTPPNMYYRLSDISSHLWSDEQLLFLRQQVTFSRYVLRISRDCQRTLDSTKFFPEPIVSMQLTFPQQKKVDPMTYYSKKVRNQVRKSFSHNLKAQKISNIDTIYQLHVQSMQRLRSKPKPKRYFELLSNSPNLHMLGCRKGRTVIAVNIYAVHRRHLHLMFNFSDQQYWQYVPNNFLYASMIKNHYDQGVRSFDFGPTMISDHSQLHFKAGFGAHQQSLHQYIWQKNQIMTKLINLQNQLVYQAIRYKHNIHD